MSLLKLYNGRVVTPFRVIPNGVVVVRDGKIDYVGVEDVSAPGAKVIDAGGRYISPGFIDIHVHGGGGHDFMDGTDRIALITDAMRAAGMPEGPSILGSLSDGLEVIVEDGVAKLPDRNADIVLFDDAITVSMTIVGGNIIYAS